MKNIVIVDLDGTLCNNDHRRHLVEGPKKDFKAFHAACVDDTPFEPIKALINALAFPDFVAMPDSHYTIVLLSGREDFMREQTIAWLGKHEIYFDQLYMRPTGDYRKDSDFKREVLYKELGGPDNILMAIDDRSQVVQMWRQEGIMCLQCAEGNF